jgi:hypothetical protein
MELYFLLERRRRKNGSTPKVDLPFFFLVFFGFIGVLITICFQGGLSWPWGDRDLSPLEERSGSYSSPYK